MNLSFHTDRRPDVEAIRLLYAAAPLRRPIHDPARIRAMFEGSNVVFCAYDGERLVGLLRGFTDHAFDGYVCDLAVHPAYQKAGIGRGLMDLLRPLGEGIQWVLLASPLAKDYYGHVGWEHLPNAWRLIRPDGDLPTYEAFQAQHADLAARA